MVKGIGVGYFQNFDEIIFLAIDDFLIDVSAQAPPMFGSGAPPANYLIRSRPQNGPLTAPSVTPICVHFISQDSIIAPEG